MRYAPQKTLPQAGEEIAKSTKKERKAERTALWNCIKEVGKKKKINPTGKKP